MQDNDVNANANSRNAAAPAPKTGPIRVRHRGELRINAHNDLQNASNFLLERIKNRVGADDRLGIGHDFLVSLVMSAFAHEANLNFIGSELFPKWEEDGHERLGSKDKLKLLLKQLEIEVDHNKPPYSTIHDLMSFRNSIAHAKPIKREFDEVLVVPEGEQPDRKIDLQAEWEKRLNFDFVAKAHQDVELVWRRLLEIARIDPWKGQTHGHSTLSIVHNAK